MKPPSFRARWDRPARAAGLAALALLGATQAVAFTIAMPTGSRAVYLRVGDGSITGGTYQGGGTPANNPTINLVSVTVPAAAVGRGASQVMAGTGRLTSDWDGFLVCTAGQVYVGGFFRRGGGAGGTLSANVTVTTPPNLTSAGGDTIPITQISWTSSSRPGFTGAQPFPAGTFTGGTQALATLPRNTWSESCHQFRYANTVLPAAGTFDARATYTMVAP